MLRLRLILLAGMLLAGACDSNDETPNGGLERDASSVSVPATPPASDASLARDATLPPAAASDASFGVDASTLTDTGDAGARADAAARTDAALAADVGVPLDAASDATSAAASDTGISEAGAPDAAPGTCAGSTPHGCWPPKAGNPQGCPAQIHEQSAFYPPVEEWEACSSPYYAACIYLRPDGSEANCSCDLGLHWLCTY